MNFLAHLLLSHESEDAMLGAIMADFLKGPHALDPLRPTLRQAIRLHRSVDQFTDTHPVVRTSVTRLAPKWGLYASVLVDMLYDHVLARDWDRWHPVPRPAFSDLCYRTLEPKLGEMPPTMVPFVTRMIQFDFLNGYATREGMALSLTRLSGYLRHRLNKPVDLAPAMDDFDEHDRAFTEEFNAFWPELAGHAERIKNLVTPR